MKLLLRIIKIGGNIIDDETKLKQFLKNFTSIQGKKILVHGGGKLATKLAEQLNVPQQLIDGRRITDAETLKIVTMVYAGLINKNIVAQLQADGCNAIGLSGVDGNAIQAHKRSFSKAFPFREDLGEVSDYGFAGDIDLINIDFFKNLLEQTLTPVIAPISHDKKGQLLNTNADTIAQEIAKAMSTNFDAHLIYLFERSGVLMNASDDTSVIDKINPGSYKELKDQGLIFSGMIPKLDNAFAALNNGVKKVIIGKAEDIHQLIKGEKGTSIVSE